MAPVKKKPPRRAPKKKPPRRAPRFSKAVAARSEKVTRTVVRDPVSKAFFDVKARRRLTPKEALRRIALAEGWQNFKNQVDFWANGAVRNNPDLDFKTASKKVRQVFTRSRRRKAPRRGPPGVKPVDKRPLFDQWFEFLLDLDAGWAEEWRKIGT